MEEIKTWRERRNDYNMTLTTNEYLALADREIADLRAFIAAAPASSQRVIRNEDGEMYAIARKSCEPLSPQPVAKVLTDEQRNVVEEVLACVEYYETKELSDKLRTILAVLAQPVATK